MISTNFKITKLLEQCRKICIVVFISFFLFCECGQNLHLSVPPAGGNQNFGTAAYRILRELIASLWEIGVIFSIAEHWTMYSYANDLDEQLLILGVNHNDLGIVLPVPSQMPRSFLEENFIDYHENKILEGTWRYSEFRAIIAKSMCRLYGKKYDLKSIVFVQVNRRILSWDEALKVHRFFENRTREVKYGEYQCQE